jgi:hypothetical protein
LFILAAPSQITQRGVIGVSAFAPPPWRKLIGLRAASRFQANCDLLEDD